MVNAFFILSNYKMKKITFIICALCLTLTEISAQVFIGDSTEDISSTNSIPQTTATNNTNPSGQATTDSKGKYKSITDLSFEFNSDIDLYGFKIGGDHHHFGMAFGDKIFSMTYGYGFGNSFVFNDAFLIKGRLYPYLGLGSYGDDTQFLYGAAANVDIGLRLWKTAKGNSGFITGGYYISAPEFKTSGMFENGSWGFGISIVYW